MFDNSGNANLLSFFIFNNLDFYGNHCVFLSGLLTRSYSHCDAINLMTTYDLLLSYAVDRQSTTVEGIIATEQYRASLLLPLF